VDTHVALVVEIEADPANPTFIKTVVVLAKFEDSAV